MLCLTVQQPFASLIVFGIKKWETRTTPAAYRGPLLIHAGKSCTLPVDLVRHGEAVIRGLGFDLMKMPRGAILGQVWLNSSRTADPQAFHQTHRDLGIFRDGWHAWELAGAVEFKSPIRCQGQPGLWSPPADILTRIKQMS